MAKSIFSKNEGFGLDVEKSLDQIKTGMGAALLMSGGVPGVGSVPPEIPGDAKKFRSKFMDDKATKPEPKEPGKFRSKHMDDAARKFAEKSPSIAKNKGLLNKLKIMASGRGAKAAIIGSVIAAAYALFKEEKIIEEPVEKAKAIGMFDQLEAVIKDSDSTNEPELNELESKKALDDMNRLLDEAEEGDKLWR